MKIWLDDVRVAPKGWVWMKTPVDVIEALSSAHLGGEAVEEISLDHDIGEKGDGNDVVKWIEAMVRNQKMIPPKMHVHSMNPVGAERMRKGIEAIELFMETIK